MSQNLVVSIVTAKIRVAKSIVAGLYQAALEAEGVPAVMATNAAPELTFENVADGDYTVTTSRIDNAGAVIGAALVDVITVKAGAVTVEQLVDAAASTSFALVQIEEPAPAPVADEPAA